MDDGMDEWMGGYPVDCYDYQSNCGANQCYQKSSYVIISIIPSPMKYQYTHLGLWNGEYRGEGSTGTV